MNIKVKFSIGEEVVVMFDSDRDYSYCECCGQQAERVENKIKTRCSIKDIRIEESTIQYGVNNLDKKYPDTTYLISEENIEKC